MKNQVYQYFTQRFAPFLQWLPELRNPQTLRADVTAGFVVALVLIPQSMAYAQLAGLPAYYGLYAAFLPPIVAALFGSSRQLATGPVAVVSLLTAAALEPIATAGSGAYVTYAILLALIVGLFQLALGLLRLGAMVNFLSHPVVLGFSNAAAIIIATSQLSKIFGVSVEKSAHHYETVWNTLVAATSSTHWPTLLLGVLAFTIMIYFRRKYPKFPGVLAAVLVTTSISWLIGFEKVQTATLKQFASPSAREVMAEQLRLNQEVIVLQEQIVNAKKTLADMTKQYGINNSRTLAAQHRLDTLRLRQERRAKSAKADLLELKTVHFVYRPEKNGRSGRFYPKSDAAENIDTDGHTWRITEIKSDGTLVVHAGGRVVGTVPQGLPAFRLPTLDLAILPQVFLSAIAIALIGFMEAISIAKAMAARTRQRLDPNQELVGQGLSNIVGSLFQSYTVSGSFSRSAVNIGAGAVTGFSSIVTGFFVLIMLLWFTPFLYHLPQATLAAVIMMAVIGLVNIQAFKHIWRSQKQDGIVALTTFILTLVFAPHLENSIVIGVMLSLILYLYRTMKPRVAVLSRHIDGGLRDADLYGLETCANISVIRFDGALYFANTSYFEDKVNERLSQKPDLKFIIVDAVGINEIDATGEEMLAQLTERLEKAGIQVLVTRIKKQVMDILRNSGFLDHVGENRIFRKNEEALDYAWKILGNNHEADCPLNIVCPVNKAN